MVQESRNRKLFQNPERLHGRIVYSRKRETELLSIPSSKQNLKLNYEEIDPGPVKLCIW